jgi:hypothetical protein
MPRTTTVTLGDLHDRAVSTARTRGMTVSALVREALAAHLDPEPSPDAVAARLLAQLVPEADDAFDR